jgi:hypothetical protein
MASSVRQKPTMLLLNRAQRAMLVDKMPDVANLAIGALSFGQFLADRPCSLAVALCGAAIWVIVAFITIIGTMDLLARRQRRRLREQRR